MLQVYESLIVNYTSLGVRGEALYRANNTNDTLVVFLHGWGGDEQSFTPLQKVLQSEKIVDTLQLAWPGFGKSDMPPLVGWDTHEYAAWFATWFDLFRAEHRKNYQKIILYGHSFGCRVIIRFLLSHKSWSYPVILTGAAGIKHPLGIKATGAQLIARSIKPIKKFIPIGLKKFVLKKIFKAHDWAEASSALKSTLAKVTHEEDLRDYLPSIKNRVLLLWGANDTYTPIESGEIFAEKLSNSKLFVFPNGKHGIHYTHIKPIVRILKNFI